MRYKDSFSRRSVLKTTGGALVGASAVDLALARPDEIVEVNVGFSAESGRGAALDAASEVIREFDALDAVTVRLRAASASRLRERGDVRYVEENGSAELLGQVLPWGIDRVDAEVAHANGETGNGADVAIIDTGIDPDHPDLEDNVGKGKAIAECQWCGYCDGCEVAWDDDHGHGTRVAGVVDAVNDSAGVVGVCTEATLHAVKVFECDGSTTYSGIAAGIEYTADQGWDVGTLAFALDSGSSVLKDACQYAYDSGVVLVGAAGNDGPCSDCVAYPARYAEVIAVSATNSNDDLAYFSSTGPEVELAAPGVDISTTTCDGGYDTFSGTSYAAAHVAGGCGHLMANGKSNTQARDTLKNTAEDIGLSSNEQGHGLLDVAASLGFDSSDST